jgi:hypothetical protein
MSRGEKKENTEPQKEVTSKTLGTEGTVIHYSGRTALRREQCDVLPKRRNIKVEANVHHQPTAG